MREERKERPAFVGGIRERQPTPLLAGAGNKVRGITRTRLGRMTGDLGLVERST
jgi:hypothetical protein